MRKHLLLSLIISLCAMSAWAADVSVVETFSGYSTNWTTVANGDWNGDICQWNVYQVRRKAESNTDMIDGALSNFLKYDKKNSKWSYMTTTNWEGGIKSVSFKYARYGSEYNTSSTPAVTGRTLKLKITAGEEAPHEVSHANNTLAAKATGENYSHTFNCKTNGQLKIENTSTAENDATTDNLCRILVGDVTITPYIYYTTKKANINIGSNTYVNTDLINNTEGEGGALTYSSANGSIATVDPSTGVVTGVAVGCTEIIATYIWPENGGEVTTRYTVIVEQPLTETFDAYSTNWTTVSDGEWNGDICQWNVYQVRRKAEDDTDVINGALANFLKYDKKNSKWSYMTTTNWEGGIKSVSFKYARYGNEYNTSSTPAVTGRTLKLKITAGNETPHEVSHANNSLAPKGTGADYSHTFNCKTNGQLKIENSSTANNDATTDNLCRILVGDVSITPYIYYTKKSAVVAVGKTYTNTGFIDNTIGEGGTLSYETSDESIATVSGGVVTGVSTGEATITAKYTWDETHYVTTTYTIHVVENNALVEDFSKIPGGSISADGNQHFYVGNYGFTWWCRNTSYGGVNYKLNDGTKGFWLSHTLTGKENTSAYIESARTDDPYQEGGIKHVSFKWHQFGNANDPVQMIKLQLKVNNAVKDVIEKEAGAIDGILVTTDQLYDSEDKIVSKSNAKFTISNISYMKNDPSTNAQGRVIIGPISITPYLFYMQREAHVLKGERYTHPLLDNTDGEGTISYSISPSSVASINCSTGEVLAKASGNATVTATWSEGAYTTYTLRVAYPLADNADNSGTISSLNTQTVDIQLADRTIRTGGYNTLCLPFAVSEETLQATLPGAKAYEFTNAYLSETNLDIRFDKRTALEAGKPYLVTVPEDVENPVFESVTIDNSNEALENNIIKGENMRFIGSYNAGTMNETGLYVVANSLYRVNNIQPEEDRTIGACRAYFDVLAGEPALGPVRMRIVAGTNTATGIDEVNSEELRVKKMLRDGHLYILRDGRMYNAQGLLIKE